MNNHVTAEMQLSVSLNSFIADAEVVLQACEW